MHVRDHGADVARAVGFSGGGEFDRVEVFGRGCVPVHCVSFVDGVNPAFLGDAHLRVRTGSWRWKVKGGYVRVREDEFTEGVV